jgi:hypothetical protein
MMIMVWNIPWWKASSEELKVQITLGDRFSEMSSIPERFMRNRDGSRYNQVIIVEPVRLTYIDKQPSGRLELPLGTFTSIYIVDDVVENVIFSPHMVPLDAGKAASLISTLEEKILGQKWEQIKYLDGRELMKFFFDANVSQYWKYVSRWKNYQKVTADIRCERRQKSVRILPERIISRAFFLISVHFNYEIMMS